MRSKANLIAPRLRLKGIDSELWRQARKALADGDICRFIHSGSTDVAMYLLVRNWDLLLSRGLAEKALLTAWTSQKRTYRYSPHMTRLLGMVDKAKLLADGDPPPDGETFTLYRGVSGNGDPYGASWTTSLATARFFAAIPYWGPGTINAITVPRSAIYAYLHDSGRTESEALLRLNGDENLTAVDHLDKTVQTEFWSRRQQSTQELIAELDAHVKRANL